ncbi:kinesin-like protein K39 isoform X1 [Arapaima gigas]
MKETLFIGLVVLSPGVSQSRCFKQHHTSHLMERSRTQRKNFQVFVRLCPQEQRDSRRGDAQSIIRAKRPNQLVVDTGRGHQPHTMEFDAVWDETTSQKDIYDATVKPLVGALMLGFNGYVITYGSLAGGPPRGLLGSGTGAARGILAWAAEDIFSSSQAANRRVTVSFFHISNEKIYDLLESHPAEVCRIHEGDDCLLLEGLKEVEVDSAQSLVQLYQRGAINRHSGVSRGEFASRSHLIFNILVVNHGEEGLVAASKLTLVDLASPGKLPPHSGSPLESKRVAPVVQENPQEAKILKRSLAVFGNVILALSTAGCHHVPYRESKLTRVLKDCLGGNCRTSLVVTVSSNPTSIKEALNCLQLARRAMAIPERQLRCCPLQAHLPPGLFPTLPVAAPSTCHTPRRPDEREQRFLLPPLDKPGLTEGWPSLSRSTLGVQDPEAGGRERLPRPVVHLSSGTAVDCPTCQKERAIRQEYDKYIIQMHRDKEELSQQVALLEARLRSRAAEEQRGGPARGTETVPVCKEVLKKDSGDKKEVLKEDSGDKKEVLQDPLGCRAALELQDLKSQLEKDQLLLQSLEQQKETQSVELQEIREKYEKLKESVTLTVAQLSREKVSAENARLREKVEELLNAAGSGRCSPGHPDGLSASPEMLVVSHRVSERCPAGEFRENCPPTSAPHGSPRSPPVPNDCDDGLLQMKDIFRQL